MAMRIMSCSMHGSNGSGSERGTGLSSCRINLTGWESCPPNSTAIVARLGRLFSQPEFQFLGAESMGKHASVQPAVLVVLDGPSHADQERLGAAVVQRFDGEQRMHRKLPLQ